jgi:hypothetical protein
MGRRLPKGPWDPAKIPRIRICLPHASSLVNMGDVPLDQLDDRIGRTGSVRSSWTERIALITRRSEVQILPPPLSSSQVGANMARVFGEAVNPAALDVLACQ